MTSTTHVVHFTRVSDGTMPIPATPHDEAQRVTSLRDLPVFDTRHEERFDRLTGVARRLFDAPIALLSLVDTHRQWFKPSLGLDVSETSRGISFCAHAILQDDVFVIHDALSDERFCNNPLVTGEPHIRFYAGCPLALTNGFKLGTLCVIDRVPRDFTDDDRALLQDLAMLAEHELTGLHDAITDPLTGISNRDGFTMLGSHTLKVCNHLGQQVSLMFFDVASADLGANRLVGVPTDSALQAFAAILLETFSDSDVIGRLGDEQFGVLSSHVSDSDTVGAVARLRLAVERHNDRNARSGPVLAYDIGSAIGDPTYEIAFERLCSAAASDMRPQIGCANARL